MTKKKALLLLLVLTLSLALGACGRKDKAPTPDENGEELPAQVVVEREQIEAMNEQAQNQAKRIAEMEEEIKFYKDYLLETIEIFTPEQLQEVIDNEWNYTIKINNVDFPRNSIMEISETEFTMYLTEKRVKHTVLSPELSKRGRYSGSLTSILSMPSAFKPERTEEEISDIHKVIAYEFKDLSPGDEIVMRIPRAFQEMMGYADTNLKIIIR